MNGKMALLATLTLFLNLVSHGQFEKGDRMVGVTIGSALYNTGTSEVTFPAIRGYTGKTTSYNVSLNPTTGWFISDNTAIGVSLNINPSGQKSRYTDNGTAFQQDKSTSFNIGIGAFARKYLENLGSFRPFGQFGFTLGISSVNTDGFKYFNASPDYKTTYTGKSSGGFFANAALVVGLTKMISDYTGLDITLGYIYSYSKNTIKTTTLTDTDIDGDIDQTSINEPTTKFTNHGFTLGVGFQIFLPGKKK